MPTSPDAPDSRATDQTTESAIVTARIRAVDLARLDHAAARRGIEREEVVIQAIDAFLAREMWSGGFIAPPPPMEIPRPFPWHEGAFGLKRRR